MADEKYENRPNTNVETFISLSKDGKYFISKTVSTRIFPRKYLDRVLEGPLGNKEGATSSIFTNHIREEIVPVEDTFYKGTYYRGVF